MSSGLPWPDKCDPMATIVCVLIAANLMSQHIGFMKNKNYIKSLFKKKFTFMNKYSLGYSQSSGKGRIEVTFAKSPSNA